jgi:hypothetical protein
MCIAVGNVSFEDCGIIIITLGLLGLLGLVGLLGLTRLLLGGVHNSSDVHCDGK